MRLGGTKANSLGKFFPAPLSGASAEEKGRGQGEKEPNPNPIRRRGIHVVSVPLDEVKATNGAHVNSL